MRQEPGFGEMRTRDMEPETRTGVGRLDGLGQIQMGLAEMETRNGEIGPRKMEF